MVCKVLIDGRKIDDFGIGTHLKAFLSQIKNNNKFEFKIILKKRKKEIPLKQFTFSFGEYSPFSILFFGIFTRFIKHDLLYVPFFNLSPFSKNSVITVHDLIHLKFPEIYGKKSGYSFFKKYFRYSINKAKKIFVVSDTTKKDLEEFFPRIKEKIIKIPNSTDPLFYKEYNFIKENYFCFIGNNKPHKNLNFLLNVWKDFVEKYLEYYLYLICPIDLNLKNVKVFKNLKTEEVIKILGKAKAIISPSIYEGFNLPVLEAILLQTPVLASKIPSNLEILSENYPYLFDFDKNDLFLKMENLIKENEKIIETLKNIKEKNQNTPENLARNILKNLN